MKTQRVLINTDKNTLLSEISKYPRALFVKRPWNHRNTGYLAIPFSVNPQTKRFTELHKSKLNRFGIIPANSSLVEFGKIKGSFCSVCSKRIYCEVKGDPRVTCSLLYKQNSSETPALSNKRPAAFYMNPQDIANPKDLAHILELNSYLLTWAYSSLLTPEAPEDMRYIKDGVISANSTDPGVKVMIYRGTSGAKYSFRLPKHGRRIFDYYVKGATKLTQAARTFGYPYEYIKIPKKKGGFREIYGPNKVLKTIQRRLLQNIFHKLILPEHITAFNPKSTIVKNAAFHVKKDIVFCMDLKDFFPSIGVGMVKKAFDKMGFNCEMSHMLTTLTTHKSVLVQGPPTSPFLSNFVFLELDRAIAKISEKYQLTYSRYADDLTFSGNKRSRRVVDKFISIIKKLVAQRGFSVHDKKTKIARRYKFDKKLNKYVKNRQIVTGLVVNDGVAVRSKWRNNLQTILYRLEHNKPVREYDHQVRGLISFYNQVDPIAAGVCQKRLDNILSNPGADSLFGCNSTNCVRPQVFESAVIN